MDESMQIKFIKAIQDANFTLTEMAEFQVNPSLAIQTGIAIGYRLGIDYAENVFTKALEEKK